MTTTTKRKRAPKRAAKPCMRGADCTIHLSHALPVAPAATASQRVFVAEAGGTYVCGACIPKVDGLEACLGDNDVQVWKEGSGGWLARDGMTCRLCARAIAVVLEKEASDE